jgi:CRP-like cAMP-binding protein
MDELKSLPLLKYAPGDAILEQGHEDGRVYFLEKGSVQVLKNGILIAEVSEQGAVFGEMAVLLKIPHTATVRAVEESHLYVIEEPEEFLKRHPEASLHVARILAKRLDSLNRYLVDVKSQFKEFDDHVSMVDEVLDTLMAKHPREIARRDPGEFD